MRPRTEGNLRGLPPIGVEGLVNRIDELCAELMTMSPNDYNGEIGRRVKAEIAQLKLTKEFLSSGENPLKEERLNRGF